MNSRASIIGLILAIIFFIGAFAYFVGGITAVYNIKYYKYSLTRTELEQQLLDIIERSPGLTFNPTDTTGTERSGLAYYADIRIRTGTNKYEFSIKYYEKADWFDSGIKSEISLVKALDVDHRTGGYSSEAPGVDRLVGVFEKEVVNKIGLNTSR